MSIALAMPMSSHAAVCPPYAEALTILAEQGMKAALDVLIQSLLSSFTSQLQFFASFKVGSIKVATSQVATAARAVINAEQNIEKGQMSAHALLETGRQQLRIFQDYSVQTGQGVDPCRQLNFQRDVLRTTAIAVGRANEMVAAIHAAPGRFGDNLGYVNSMLSSRYANFATPDEEKLGYGKASTKTVTANNGDVIPLAGADTNASILFADSSDPLVAQAKQNYINYIAGSPDAPINRSAASNGAGRQYLNDKARKDATVSVGVNSVAQVAAEYDPTEEMSNTSKMGAMTKVVGMYYGELAKDTWRMWMSQSERGLAVDAIKMSAAHLSFEVDQLKQSQRMEALIGTLLAAETQDMKPEVDEAYQAVVRSNVSSGLR